MAKNLSAWKEAERLVAQAIAVRSTELSLAGLRIESLPEQIVELAPYLTRLDLAGCWKLADLGLVSQLTALQHINLSGCDQVSDLSVLAQLKSLQHLDLGWCDQVSDLSVLAQLISLQHLDLSGCSKVDDLSALAQLTSLQHLDLSGCRQFSDLSVLAQFTSLQHLDLSGCRQFSDLSVLAQLTSLQHLDLGWCDQISDLSVLVQLTSLQRLDLSGCSKVDDHSVLAHLTSLQHLDLSWCAEVDDLSMLARLTALQHLGLNGCSQVDDLSVLARLTALQHLGLSWCSQVDDLSVLARLTALQHLDLSWCDQVDDLSVLAQLTSLQHLDLGGCEQVSDLNLLARLTALQHLDLSGCDQVSDLSVLAQLTNLRYLDLSECVQISDLMLLTASQELRMLVALGMTIYFDPLTAFFEEFPRLSRLWISDFAGAPKELCDKGQSNCLPALEHWYDDLVASGATPNTDVKVFILGNGHAGKTQIVRRLSGHAFDPAVSSTHGIAISDFELLPASADGPALQAKVWDFGGQDIYLGTHSLFLDDRAIFVLVWTPDTENDGTVIEQGVTMQHRRLDYWLDYVRSLVGDQAPVLVVQSQCDRESLLQEAPIVAGHGFGWLRRTACSAATDDGMDRVWPELKAAAKLLRERHGKVALPCSWVAIGQTLQQRASSTRVLSRKEFDTLCADQHISAPEAVLSYLHLSGQVFWRPGVFNGDVVLDQAWALDGVYSVLHRDSVLPLIRSQSGLFTQELLGLLLWNEKYSKADQKHFMSLMTECGVCFEVSQGQYLAPDCLPARAAVQDRELGIWRGASADATATLRYSFLHDGIKRGLLCAVGKQAGIHAVYWQHGLCFFDARSQVVVRLDCRHDPAPARSGNIVLEVSGANASVYARDMVQSIQRGIQIGQAPEVVWSGLQAGALKPQLRDDHGNEGDHKPAAPFVNIHAAPRPADGPSAKPVVHVSYAWVSESEDLVDKLEARLKEICTFRRDCSVLRSGDWISKFMAEIGQSQCVLVVFSAKYLKSHNCMRELLYLHQTSLGDKAAMLERIVPLVLGDANIGDQVARLAVAQHWKSERERLEAATHGLDPLAWGDSTRHALMMIHDFEHHSADMLTWAADVLMPRGAALSADNFEAVVELLQRRFAS